MMADFLTRLAGQALGARPAIRPDIAPVFGPAASIDTHLKPLLDSEGSLTSAAIPQASRSMALQPLEEERPLMEREAQDEPQPVMNRVVPVADKKAGLLPPEPVLIPPLRSPRIRDPRVNNGVDSERISLTPKPAYAEAQSLHGNCNWEQPPQRRQSTQGAVHVAILPQTRAATNAAVPRHEAANRMDSPAPAVHVTIGRVEVRALTPQAAPMQHISEKRVSQTQSLGEYLQERNRGRR